MNSEYEIQELKRRMDNLLRVCTVEEVDYEAARVRVRAGDFLSGWVPWLTTRANGTEVSWNAPEINERVLLLSVSGEPATSYVLPALYTDTSPPPSINPNVSTVSHSDGGHITYDRSNGTYTIQPPTAGMIRLIVGTNQITIDDTDIDIIAAGDVSVSAPAVTLTADAVNLGGTGGEKVARVGDAVNLQTGKIMEGSDVTKSI